MIVTRREVIATGAAIAMLPSAAGAAEPAPDPAMTGDALFVDVARYVTYGPKRTGSAADRAVSAWLADEARQAGATLSLRPFNVRQFQVERAVVVAGGTSIDCLPFWFPRATNGVVTARLVAGDGDAKGKILLADPGPGLAALLKLPGLVDDVTKRGAAGLIVMMRTPSGQYFGHGMKQDCGVPTLLVGGDAGPLLMQVAASGGNASIEIAGKIDPKAEGFDVVARVPGSGPLTVVTTPTSAWTSSGGERGTGVALWLGALRRAARRKRGNWLFAAFSGHELGGAGAFAFIDGPDAPKPGDVGLWCHLGASIATARMTKSGASVMATTTPNPGSRLLTNRQSLLVPLTQAFAGTSYKPELADETSARGELRLYFQRGYPVFGFEGSHDLFHAPGDTTISTCPAMLASVGAALDRLLS